MFIAKGVWCACRRVNRPALKGRKLTSKGSMTSSLLREETDVVDPTRELTAVQMETAGAAVDANVGVLAITEEGKMAGLWVLDSLLGMLSMGARAVFGRLASVAVPRIARPVPRISHGGCCLHRPAAWPAPQPLTEEPLCARHTEAMCFTACDLHFVMSS